MTPAVYLIDPRPLFRLGLAAALQDAGYRLTGQADELAGAWTELETEPPEVVVMALEPVDDLLALRELRRHFPAIQTVVVGEIPSDEEAVAVMEAGAAGYVSRNASPELVERTVAAAARGEFPIATWLLHRGVAARAREVFRELERVGPDLAPHLAPLTGSEEAALAAVTGESEGGEGNVQGSKLTAIVCKLAANGQVKETVDAWQRRWADGG